MVMIYGKKTSEFKGALFLPHHCCLFLSPCRSFWSTMIDSDGWIGKKSSWSDEAETLEMSRNCRLHLSPCACCAVRHSTGRQVQRAPVQIFTRTEIFINVLSLKTDRLQMQSCQVRKETNVQGRYTILTKIQQFLLVHFEGEGPHYMLQDSGTISNIFTRVHSQNWCAIFYTFSRLGKASIEKNTFLNGHCLFGVDPCLVG